MSITGGCRVATRLKSPPDPASPAETWSLPFAGFLLLVVAAFAVLYSRARTEADSLRSRQGSTLQSAPRDLQALGSELLEGGADGLTGTEPPGLAGGNALPAGTGGTEKELEILFDRRGLVVRLAAVDFFEDGKATVSPELRPLLDRVGRALAHENRQVRIEGHTDREEEAHLGSYPSGWELSEARASWVLRYWVARFGLDPGRLGAVGFSHFRPLGPETDAWSRGRNRRVEVVVISDGEGGA